jgi:hypothetical protein
LIHGLVPGIGELIETVVHRATTGHFAHVAGDVHDEEQNSEHGCGATAHRCGCCASLPMVASLVAELIERRPIALGEKPVSDRAPANDIIATLFRPPIA